MNEEMLRKVKAEAHQIITGRVEEVLQAPILGLQMDENVVLIIVKVK